MGCSFKIKPIDVAVVLVAVGCSFKIKPIDVVVVLVVVGCSFKIKPIDVALVLVVVGGSFKIKPMMLLSFLLRWFVLLNKQSRLEMTNQINFLNSSCLSFCLICLCQSGYHRIIFHLIRKTLVFRMI